MIKGLLCTLLLLDIVFLSWLAGVKFIILLKEAILELSRISGDKND